MIVEEKVAQVNTWACCHWSEVAVRRQAQIEELVSLLREAIEYVEDQELVYRLVRRDEIRNGALVLDFSDRIKVALEGYVEEKL